MSVRLNHGLRVVDPSLDLYEITALIAPAIRVAHQKLKQQLVAEHLVRLFDEPSTRTTALALDHRGMPSSDLNRSRQRESRILTLARRLWLHQQNGEHPTSTFHDPLRFSMVFGRTSADDGSQPRTLAYSFCHERAYRDALMSIEHSGRPLFEDYHYQNGTDGPKDVPDDLWQQRLRDWEQVLGDERTMEHLPSWQLHDTVGHAFSDAQSGRYTAPGSELLVDLNTLVTQEQRRKKLLHAAVTNSAVRHYANDCPEGSGLAVASVFSLSCDALDAVDQFIADSGTDGWGFPAPLPGHSANPQRPSTTLDMAFDELPEIWQPPADAVQMLSDRVLAAQTTD